MNANTKDAKTAKDYHVIAKSPEPLIACLKCGHTPCPHCGDWCDVLVGEDSDLCCEGECTFSDEAKIQNARVFAWYKKESERLKTNTSSLRDDHVVILSMTALIDWRQEADGLRAKLDEITRLATAVARISFHCYQDPVIECLACHASMNEGAGKIHHSEDCPLVTLRAALKLDEDGFEIIPTEDSRDSV